MTMFKAIFYLFFIMIFVLFPLVARAEYVELHDLLRDTGSQLEWEPIRSMGRIVKGQEWVVFKVGAPVCILGQDEALPTDQIIRKEGNIFFPKETALRIQEYLLASTAKMLLPRVAYILIDPGHGGRDPGAIGKHQVGGKLHLIKEKDVVLDVSKRLYNYLKVRYPEKKIFLIRDNDSFLELEERTRLANSVSLAKNEAIIFISMHAHASFKKDSKGFEVWYLPPDYKRELIGAREVESNNREILPILNTMLEVEFSAESVMLAEQILEELETKVGEVTINRGLKAETWFVVRNSKMPSVLIELGFITNLEEGLLLENEEYLQKLAEGIYNGVSNFIARFENTKGFTE